jgi:hypothetical protein
MITKEQVLEVQEKWGKGVVMIGALKDQSPILKGKIYIKSKNDFVNIYSNLVCLRDYNLN